MSFNSKGRSVDAVQAQSGHMLMHHNVSAMPMEMQPPISLSLPSNTRTHQALECLCGVLALLVLLANFGDVQACGILLVSAPYMWLMAVEGDRTRGQGLLELLGLVGVLDDESVQAGRASDLELGRVVGLALLYARSYNILVRFEVSSRKSPSLPVMVCRGLDVHWASLRRQISMN